MNASTRSFIAHGICFAVSSVLVAAAVLKVLSIDQFERVTMTIEWIPLGLREGLPLLIPIIEITLAFLLSAFVNKVHVAAVAALLAAFTVFLAIQYFNPYAPRCSCFGLLTLAKTAQQEALLGIVRNLLLLSALAAAFILCKQRDEPATESQAPQSGFSAKTHRHAHGFTLTELLIVIGVISLLIGIAVPVVSRARRSASSTACQASLRNVGQALQALATERNGFTMLAGQIRFLTTPTRGHLASTLNDSSKARYKYWPGDDSLLLPWGESVVPFPYVLMTMNDSPGLVTDSSNWSRTVERNQALRAFSCASLQNSASRTAAYISYFDGTAGWEDAYESSTGYAVNEWVFGFDGRSTDSPLRGNWSTIPSPSGLLIAGDANFSSLRSPYGWWSITDEDHSTLNLYLNGPGSVYGIAPDVGRHSNQINLLFADGHVESRRANSLADVRLRHGRK